VSRPWEIPASALLDGRWNTAMDLASAVPVSQAKVAAAWTSLGPDRVLAQLRKLAAGGKTAETGDAA
jgi:hypothetical protein